MYNLKQETFTTYNGLGLPLWYREDTNDYNTILSILRDDEYKTNEMTYKVGDTFIDIGAHIGTWSALMEKLVPQAKVIAIEPLPENIELIKKNTNAEILQNAVAKRSGMKIKIHYADDTESGLHHKFIGNFQSMGIRGDKYFLADSISLNDLMETNCRVLKIDCEGAEHQFFRYASKETLSKIDYIIGEYHNPLKEKSKTKQALFNSMKGLFDDISKPQPDGTLGQFWFRRKGGRGRKRISL